jgi:hypothetical protein
MHLVAVVSPGELETDRESGRRLVFRTLGWGAILLLCGQLIAGAIGGVLLTPKAGAVSGWVDAGSVSSYSIGDIRRFPAEHFLLTRVPEGFIAFSTRCPRAGTLFWDPNYTWSAYRRPAAPEGRFWCPEQGDTFDRYGEEAGAPNYLTWYPLEVQSGRVWVRAASQYAEWGWRKPPTAVPVP